LELIPEFAKAFIEDRLTASHANLIARLRRSIKRTRLPSAGARTGRMLSLICFRQDILPHGPKPISISLSPKRSSIKPTLTLNTEAGACFDCPKRSGVNACLFADVDGDQCFDGTCHQAKIAAPIDRTLANNLSTSLIDCYRARRLMTLLIRHKVLSRNIQDDGLSNRRSSELHDP
jgi:ParB family chromosome partitioning protein